MPPPASPGRGRSPIARTATIGLLATLLVACAVGQPGPAASGAVSPGGSAGGDTRPVATTTSGVGSSPSSSAASAPPGGGAEASDGVPAPTPSPSGGSAAALPLATRLGPWLQEELEAALGRLRLPGVQASVVFADGSTWTGAAGLADVAAQRPVTTSTVFDVGSITKTFVAAEVLRLAEAGVLRLDDPLSRWLPSYPNAAHITLRQLLSHTSGLADYFWSVTLFRRLDAAPRTPWNARRLLPYIGKPLFKPGTEWRYSNTNYLLLGMVVEAATRRTLESELQTRFLGPLGLRHTVLQDDAPVVRAVSAGPLALPYRRAPNGSSGFVSRWDGSGYLPYTSLATALGPVGGIASRADEIARWGAALYGGRVVSADSLAAMEDVGISRPFKPAELYGLGTVQLVEDGYLSYGHGGAVTGYRAALRYFPDFGATVAVLTNLDGADPDAVVGTLLGVLSAASRWREGGPARD